MTLLYGLLDPRTRELRYIGKTSTSLAARLRLHLKLKKGDDSYRARWVRKLPYPPLIELLDEVHGDGASEERAMIGVARSLGARLTNTTDGGDGAPGYRHSEETRARLRAMKLGTKASEETRLKMSVAHKGRTLPPFTQAHKDAISKARTGRKFGPRSEETKEKIRAAVTATKRRNRNAR